MKRRILTITSALLLAVLGTAGVLAYVHQADARAVAGVRAVTTLVAQQQIPAGTSASAAVHEGLLISQRLPASSVPDDAVSSITPDLGSLVLGANVQSGQLLLRPMLVTSAQATSAGALAIPKGMVAVTIPLCLPEAVAGYVQPGSEVAVFDTYSKSQSVGANCGGSSGSGGSGGSSASGAVRTRVVLPRVLVLSVGPAPAGGTNSTTASGGTSSTTTASGGSATASTSSTVLVTMAVNQANAERLILLTETGASYLALLTASSHTGFDTTTVPLFQP